MKLIPTLSHRARKLGHIEFLLKQLDYKVKWPVITPTTGKIEVMVIVGYSFPHFNRSIDDEHFRRMKSLKKIYIQDPHLGISRKS